MSPGQHAYETFRANFNEHPTLRLKDVLYIETTNGRLNANWETLPPEAREWWERYAMAVILFVV